MVPGREVVKVAGGEYIPGLMPPWGRAHILVVLVAAVLPACGSEPLSPSDPVTEPFASVAAGTAHTCGVTVGGIAYCWGLNQYGQIGDGSRSDRPLPILVATTLRFATLTGGGGHTCGRTSAGTAYCWGINLSGQLGSGPAGDRLLVPAAVSGGLTLGWIAAGGAFTCGLAADSTASCWGWNALGQLGDLSRSDRSAPVAVAGGLKLVSLHAGTWHVCAVAADSSAYCWGRNAEGALGNGATTDTAGPVAVQGGLKFVSVTAGSYHSCALTASGDAYCWGDGQFGQLGDSTGGSTTPRLVLGGHTFVAIAAGATHTCALATGGAGYCWGNDTNGQLGTNVPLDVCSGTRVGDVLCSLVPVPVAGGLSFASLTTGFHHTCGVTTAGLAYCWGLNDFGQLGSQAGRGSITPVRVANQQAAP